MISRERYFVKIVPLRGDVIHRFEITRRHIIALAGAFVAVVFGALALHAYQLHQAKTQLQSLQTLTATQSRQLEAIDRQTGKLKVQLQTVQKQNQQLGHLMGIRTPSGRAKGERAKRASGDRRAGFSTEAAWAQHRLSDLAADSQVISRQAASVRRITLRILNVRHIRALERDRLLAAIPSIDPVEGAPVVGCFCYRSSPDFGFHAGVDLGAQYGQTVRAAAAGTIASAEWDGGFGMKIDIDHGNGYHSWYAHLSKMNVNTGERVVKGQPIGLVGSTGFSTGPHLHYQVMLNGTPIDPAPFLRGT